MARVGNLIRDQLDSTVGGTGNRSWTGWDLLGISTARAADQESAALEQLGSLIADYYRDVSDAGLVRRILVGVGAAPIPKRLFRIPVVGNASSVTNPISHFGLRVFPNLKSPVRLLGSNRVFGIAGRANILLATGLASYDATSILLSIPVNDELTIGDKLNQVLLDPLFTYP